MKVLFSLLHLINLILCVLSQDITLDQPESAIVKPSDTLKLTCKLSVSVSSAAWSWVRQIPGKALEYIGYIDSSGGTGYAPSFKGRVTIGRDTAKNEVTLQVPNMKTDESGKYYCARGYFDYWGQGTMVTVTSAEISSPFVYPIISPPVEGSATVTFGCLADSFLPPPAEIYISGDVVSGTKNFPATLGTSGKYSMSSQATATSANWKTNTYQCRVAHNNVNITKTIPKGCNPPPPANINVKLMQASCPESDKSGQVRLVCQVSSLTSEEVEVKWFINDKEQSFQQEKILLGKTSNNLYNANIKVNVSQSVWNNGAKFKCQANDTKTNKVAENSIRKCSESFNCLGINVFMIPPSIEEIYIHRTAPVRCLANNIPNDSSIKFTWTYPNSNAEFTTEDPIFNTNGTYSVISILIVSTEAWNSGTEFTCTFTYSSLPSPVVKTIKKNTDIKLIAPRVYIFPPAPEELALKEDVTITCLASGFYPMDIYMGWNINESEVSKQLSVNTDPKSELDQKTFFMISKMTVNHSVWDSGTPCTCVVAHEGLQLNITQRTIDKSDGKPTNVNVSVTLSESSLTCY